MWTLTLTPYSGETKGMPYQTTFESNDEPYSVWRAKYVAAVAELIERAEGAHPKFWDYDLNLYSND